MAVHVCRTTVPLCRKLMSLSLNGDKTFNHRLLGYIKGNNVLRMLGSLAERKKAYTSQCIHTALPRHTRNTKNCFNLTSPFSTTTEVEDEETPDDLYRQLDVEVKGHDPEVLNSYEKFVTMVAQELDIQIGKIFAPPKVITRKTLLKSVHIHKKHRVQYEWRTHYRLFELKHLTGSTADTFLEYIQRNLPEGVAMKVTRYRLEQLPDHISEAIKKNREDGSLDRSPPMS